MIDGENPGIDFYPEERKKQTKQEEKAKRLHERELGDLRKILSMPEGRRFIWWLLSEAMIFRSTFTGNSTSFFNEGRRSLGLRILANLMEAKPEAFAQMQREYLSEKKQEEGGM